MVSQVTAKQDDRIKRHFDFLFSPCIFIALENLSGDGVWMLGVCTARRMLLSIKAPVGKSKCRNEKDYDRLRKLSRAELLELLLEESRENERLRAQLQEMNEKLADRAIRIERAGSIAEAALQLNGVFQAAEEAAAQYLENVRRLAEEQTQ